jgi:hypothetical protein
VRPIEHARRVAVAVADHGDRAVVAALLHETVEKGCLAWRHLVAAVDDAEVVRAVDALTRRHAEGEVAYLRRCAHDPIAVVVRRADLLEELDPGDETGCRLGWANRRRVRERLMLLRRLINEGHSGHGAATIEPPR